MSLQVSPPARARFAHESGYPLLRLQTFLIVRDAERRVACLRLQETPDAWHLPGESMLVNESPQDAAARVARLWFESPLSPRLVDVQSYPATGPDDDRWYMLFIYEAEAPKALKGTPDTAEISFAPVGKAPGEFAMDHADVFARLER